MKDNFENISIGDEAEVLHTITSKDVDSFVDLTGDTNPLHTDEDYAASTLFRKPVVHGMLPACFISTMIGTIGVQVSPVFSPAACRPPMKWSTFPLST